VIKSTVGNAVHVQTLYLCAGLLVVCRRMYCIILSSYCIFTAKDINIDLFELLLLVIMVVVARLLLLLQASDTGEIASIRLKLVYTNRETYKK
jgi:hypothetical protein